MTRTPRVLLIEHVDATGGAPEDARAHHAALRQAGYTVESLVLDGRGDDDLQYDAHDRQAGPGPETLLPDAAGLRQLTSRVHTGRADFVVWASAAPRGGEASACLPDGTEAFWWPTGHAPKGTPTGTLPPLPGLGPPCGGSVYSDERTPRVRLSLWDGPFVLVPSPPAAESAAQLIAAFARAADGRDEVDLVVLDHPNRAVEALARDHGIGQRVHFMGPAPREAEAAWFATAALALLPGDAPVSGGLLLRALAAGCAPVPVGQAAAPIAAWQRSAGCAWPGADDTAGIAATIGRALDRGESARHVSAHAQAVARQYDVAALAVRLASALRATGPESAAA